MTATLLDALIGGHTDRGDEERILSLLGGAPASELDALVRDVDAGALFRSIDDHLLGPANRAALRDLLVARLDDLGLQARANLAYGLQSGRTDAADERALHALVRAHRGEELTRFKNQVNMRTDAHDLEGLVFADIDDAGVREDVLAHLATEAAGVVTGKAKVLSDIDDTVVCALHDRRYPRGTLYPGVLALYDALDQGATDRPFSVGDLTFVTARPGDALGLIENHTRASLRRAGIASHSVLTGGLISLVTHDAMAARKVANIRHYHALFPEYRMVFLGDSGQGDVAVGRALLGEFADVVDVVLIHDVVDTPPDARAALAEEGLQLFDTYIGAARLAAGKGLISARGFTKVIDEALAALPGIAWTSPAQEAGTRALFERDAAAA